MFVSKVIFLKIKDTKSLCPECGKPLDAEVYDEGGKVYIIGKSKIYFVEVKTQKGKKSLYQKNL